MLTELRGNNMLTELRGNKWVLRSGVKTAQAIERLACFEGCLDYVQVEYRELEARLADLRKQARQRSATFHQVLGQKMTISAMLSRFRAFDLLPEEDEYE